MMRYQRNNLKRSLKTRAMTDQRSWQREGGDDKMETSSVCSSASTASASETEEDGASLSYADSPQPPQSRVSLGNLPSPSSKRFKSVWFEEQRNEYHKLEQPSRTNVETKQCWYSDAEIKLMRDDSMAAASLLFTSGGKNTNNQNSKSSRVNSFRQRLRQHQRNCRAHTGSAQRPHSPVLPPSSSTPSRDREASSLATLSLNTKRGLANAYKESNRIRTEQDFEAGVSPVSHDALAATYKQFHDEDALCLVGLEVYILYGLRGESARQTRYILEAVRQRTAHCPEQRDEYMRMMSQYISLPSRVFVRELAHAQAQALRDHNDE